jgi:hypothetical protein
MINPQKTNNHNSNLLHLSEDNRILENESLQHIKNDLSR